MIKSKFIKEQKQYSLNDIKDIFDFETEEAVRFLKILRQHGVIKVIKNKDLDLSDLFFASENDEVDEAFEISSEDSSNAYIFKFVGVLLVENVVIKCYPKYIESENYEEHLKLVIKVLEKYNDYKQIIPLVSDFGLDKHFNLLAIYVYLIRDYLEYGSYINEEHIYEINGRGEINWNKTINETVALLRNNRPFYSELITRRKISDDLNYFQRLHLAILTHCSKQLEKSGLLDLFNLIPINESEEKIIDFGDYEFILYQLEKELNNQFLSRKQYILNLMMAFITQQGELEYSDKVSVFGTTNFKKIWETVCQETLNNQLKVSVLDLELPNDVSLKYNKNDNLLNIIERPIWEYTEDKNFFRLMPKGSYEPDIVTVEEKKGDYSLNIYDAKYYKLIPNINNSTIINQPGIEAVSKQFLYQLAYNDFITLSGISKVNNYFLIPTEDSKVYNLEVSMRLFRKLGLNDIIVKFLKAKSIYEKYLEGGKISII